MSNKPRDRYCIRQGNLECEVFSIEERSSGDLIIAIKHAENYFPADQIANTTENPEGSKIIANQKYSIHGSLESPTANLIKMTMVHEGDDSPILLYHYTSAIKEINRFAHIFSRRCLDMIDEKFRPNPNKTKNKISMDSYDAKSFVMYFSLFVCSSNSNFDIKRCVGFKLFKYEYRLFHIYVFISYFPGITTNLGQLAHSMTLKKEDIPDIDPAIDFSIRGYDQNEVTDFHLLLTQMSKETVIAEMRNIDFIYESTVKFIRKVTISKGYKHSREYREAMKKI